jgi:hypothetical protein
MATFLQLAQDMRREAGLSGSGPADVTAATGIELRLVNGIKRAWLRIQNHPKDWKWMWEEYDTGSGPLQTIINTTDYVLTDVGKTVYTNTFYSYLTATGTSDRQKMVFMNYEKFKLKYGAVTADASRPIVATLLPNGDLRLHPKPDATGYSIEFEIQKAPQVLAANADVPELPSRYHDLIVYEALKHFGKAEDAPEVIKLAEEEGGSEGGPEGRGATGMWRDLIWDQEYKSANQQSQDAFMTVVPQ